MSGYNRDIAASRPPIVFNPLLDQRCTDMYFTSYHNLEAASRAPFWIICAVPTVGQFTFVQFR